MSNEQHKAPAVAPTTALAAAIAPMVTPSAAMWWDGGERAITAREKARIEEHGPSCFSIALVPATPAARWAADGQPDPWRGLYHAALLPTPTEYGDIAHPDIPSWPDDREDALDKLVRAQGFDYQIVAGEFTEAAMDDGDELYWQEMRAWYPEAPEDGWRLAWKGDTEDGPYAWFVRPMALRPETAAPPAQGIDLAPRPMDAAPRDGTMVRLLVEFTEHATEDTARPAWTIGANNHDHDGEDAWMFAGWCWTHDHFTEGKGTPIGWLPLIDSQRDAAPGVGNG